MTDDMMFSAPQRRLIEEWQRSAMKYGWTCARLGLDDPPDPLFTWRDGYPEVVVDGAVPGEAPS